MGRNGPSGVPAYMVPEGAPDINLRPFRLHRNNLRKGLHEKNNNNTDALSLPYGIGICTVRFWSSTFAADSCGAIVDDE